MKPVKLQTRTVKVIAKRITVSSRQRLEQKVQHQLKGIKRAI